MQIGTPCPTRRLVWFQAVPANLVGIIQAYAFLVRRLKIAEDKKTADVTQEPTTFGPRPGLIDMAAERLAKNGFQFFGVFGIQQIVHRVVKNRTFWSREQVQHDDVLNIDVELFAGIGHAAHVFPGPMAKMFAHGYAASSLSGISNPSTCPARARICMRIRLISVHSSTPTRPARAARLAAQLSRSRASGELYCFTPSCLLSRFCFDIRLSPLCCGGAGADGSAVFYRCCRHP
nr:MAG TPA: hypothetical protein [Bacteriophage sp.]